MNTYPVGEAAKRIGVSRTTLQRWDREGRLKALRSPTNQRYYTDEQIASVQGIKVTEPWRSIAYCRVSSSAQKPDLKNQREILDQFVLARGIANVEFMTEIGGGLNFERKQFLAIMDAVQAHEVKTLIIAHKDRLVRFGYAWFSRFCERNSCEILVLNQEKLSPEHEMVQDLMTIVHCFSSRLYGLRNYRKKLKEAMDQDAQGT